MPKLNEHTLPSYTKGEELFNSISHLIGVGIGILAIIFTIIFNHNHYGLISGVIFGSSLIILYSVSATYHGLSLKKLVAKKVFRIIDHCSIFILIAGSYTPLVLCAIRPYSPSLGWTFFILTWSIAALGVTLNAIDLKKYKIFSMICYLVMGWSIIFRSDVLFKTIGFNGFIFLITGGIAYSVGFVFYAIGKKYKWMHSIFHILCLVGSILHCICVLKYAI